MASTIPLPDTSAAVEKKAIGNIRGVSPIKPLTSKVAVPKPKQPSPGLSTKPVTTGATPQGAKLKQPPRSTGRVNSGNSTADSIITALGKIGLAYADSYTAEKGPASGAFSDFFIPSGGFNVGSGSFTGSTNLTLAAMKDGGFVQKRNK